MIPLSILFIFLLGCSSIPGYSTTASRQGFVSAHPDLSEKIKNDILNKSVSIGMTKDQVLASWGRPSTVGKVLSGSINMESWTYYHSKVLYFEGDKLVSLMDIQ